jgi:fatty-acyl-CoA synthase
MQPRSKTWGSLLDELAERRGQHEALNFEGRSWTWQDVARETLTVARGLIAAGVRPGDRVAMLSTNRPEWFMAVFGAIRIGAVAVPLNTWFKRRELQYVLEHSDARAIILMPSFRSQTYVEDLYTICPELRTNPSGATITAATPALPNLVAIFSINEERWAGVGTWSALQERAQQVTIDEVIRAQAAVKPEDLALLVYTSGSTAFPKAVQIHHRLWIENGRAIGERMHIVPEDRFWLGLPLSFAFGSVNLVGNAFTHGASIIIQEYFEPELSFRTLAKSRSTVFYASPNMIIDLATYAGRDAWTLPSLKKGCTFGPPEVLRMASSLGVEQMCNGYGGTEVYGWATLTEPDEPFDARANCQGPPLPTQEVKVVDPQTREILPTGCTGLLCVRGAVTSGYAKDPTTTAAVFDADGFYLSGDLGYFDQEGRVHFVGRGTDMIKTGGINVCPAELEDLLQGHPSIRQAHVVGIPDPIAGELIVAVVERKAEMKLISGAELQKFIRSRLAAYKVPHHVLFGSNADLPRTSTGKVPKRLLREKVLVALSGAGPFTR